MGGKSAVVDRDRGWRAMMAAVEAMRGGAYAKVGVLADDERGGLHQVDPDTGKSADLTVAEIAAVQEFGTEDKQVPERPFLRPTFDKMAAELASDARKLLLQILDGKISVDKALNVLGAKLANAVKATITEGEGVPPPNAPSTLKAKEAAGAWNKKGKAQTEAKWGPRTLVDTARMLNAITWAVVAGRKAREVITSAVRAASPRG